MNGPQCAWRQVYQVRQYRIPPPTRHSSRVELSLLTANHRMGVDIETLKPGDGANFPKPGQKVHCHYVLTLTNGTKVDSSRDRGQPFSFSLGRGEVRYRPGGDTGLMIYY